MLISFGTKAETLERLRPILKLSTILPQVRFTVREWDADAEGCLEKIRSDFSEGAAKLILRSSSLSEDASNQSNAGKFQSVPGIDWDDTEGIRKGVEQVIASYGSQAPEENQIFIQPLFEDVALSGVIFTRDLDTWAPYYVVNYDDRSHQTDLVTSGRSSDLKTLIKFRDYPTRAEKLKGLFEAVEEVEKSLGCDYLDIEFAISSSGKIYLLQVRPLVKTVQGPLPDASQIGHYLKKMHKKVTKLNHPHPYLYGKRTLLGVMPDWNPAEMIGVKPRPLALSLYKELITDRTWAYQRDNYGYKNLRSYPLLVTLIGHPYIDVRVSFSSFIPKEVPDELASRLGNYYLDSLEKTPSSHDKVEFDIILSCFFLNIDERFKKMESDGFSKSDLTILRNALLRLTNNIIFPPDGVFRSDLGKIEELKIRQEKVISSSLSDLEKIYWLSEDCGRYGTLPFAGLARAGFIAVQILRSLVAVGLLSSEDLNHYMASLNTVAKQMGRDRQNLPCDEFLKIYGHLRPGTYDILSARYDEAYDLYFNEAGTSSPVEEPFEFSSQTLNKLDRVLKREGIAVDSVGLLRFLREAIEGREHSKFVFTRSVSEILKLVRGLASHYDLDAEEASFIDIRTLKQLYATLDHRDLSDILKEEIDRNRRFYEVTKLMRLPPLIVYPEDVFEFELEEGSPNYVTLGRSQGSVVREESILTEPLAKKIVCIRSADPGYDWIFTKDIAGLITMYGGANSHMAIRAAELRIPSVIGAGEKNYRLWSRAQVLEIDSGNRQVRILR